MMHDLASNRHDSVLALYNSAAAFLGQIRVRLVKRDIWQGIDLVRDSLSSDVEQSSC